MPTNDFIGFASSGSANIATQVEYAAATEQGIGMQPGPASSKLANKVWRQGSNMAAALAKIMETQGQNAIDNGDIAALSSALTTALNQQALDAVGVITDGTVTRLLDTLETTNSTIYKIGHVGFMWLADNFPSVNAAYTYYNVATVNIIPKKEINNLCFDGNGNFAGLAWINTNGAVYIRTLASAPGHSFMRCGFTFAC